MTDLSIRFDGDLFPCLRCKSMKINTKCECCVKVSVVFVFVLFSPFFLGGEGGGVLGWGGGLMLDSTTYTCLSRSVVEVH